MLNDILKCGYVIKRKEKDLVFLEKKTSDYDLYCEGYIDVNYHIIYDSKRKTYKSFEDVNLNEDIKTNKNKGFVYLLECEGKYKIGLTKNIVQRMRFFENTLPSYPNIINYIISEDFRQIEKSLHIVFEEKRIKNEWFLLDENDLKTFDKIKNHYF